MKNSFKFFGIFALVFLLFFSWASCGGSGNNDLVLDDEDDGDSEVPEEPRPFNDISAAEWVGSITVGWNLGNSLDAIGMASGLGVNNMEKAWGNPVTRERHIRVIKEAGFNAIRIPVSWTKAMDKDYNIREDWMDRVTEVVNYAVDLDMYIMLNTHHDDEEFILKDGNQGDPWVFGTGTVAEGQRMFKKIWEQVADHFKNYDEKLIFEALNEPRSRGSGEWGFGQQIEHDNLNAYYQIFVDTVRASGGNNGKRILLINTKSARFEENCMNALLIPNDPTPNKIIAGFHAYRPNDFSGVGNNSITSGQSWSMASNRNSISSFIDFWHEKFVSQGIPVVIGEWGSVNKNNLESRKQHAEYYAAYARQNGIATFWWDNGDVKAPSGGNAGGGGILNRSNYTITHPEVVEALVKGSKAEIGGTDYLP